MTPEQRAWFEYGMAMEKFRTYRAWYGWEWRDYQNPDRIEALKIVLAARKATRKACFEPKKEVQP